MKKYIQINKGLTLVEILAAIVILAIALVSFSSFFLQSAKHTKYNEEKLTAVQVAEEVIAEVRKGTYQSDEGFPITKGNYEVDVDIVDDQADVLLNDLKKLGLKKAVITVTTKPGKGIKKAAFITEMYFEVKP